ncbi:MAG: hypothetical protein H6642_10400 [Caldilineaceae bacterium]|nr:hypothetical protein [Caldilineaceae bacterium]
MTWTLLPQPTPSPDLIAAAGGYPLAARLLAQRGMTTPEQARPFLDPDCYTPAPPGALTGVIEAAQLLAGTIRRGERILVWGDFDVDGQTSTSLLVAALRKLAGDEQIAYHVPNRFSEGHGIRVEKLARVLDDLPPVHLLLTCDTGISDGPGVAYAKTCGLTVVVTDHHDLTPEFIQLPPDAPLWGASAATAGAESVRQADAVVNPKFQAPDDPLRTLPGVGVAYKLIQQLYADVGRGGEEEEFLDLVALGIVADVAEQIHDARYLLQRGLARLRATRRIGLLALMNVAGLAPEKVDAESIGFQIGPRMNALGRLEDATVAVELLTTHDALRAGELATRMNRLNQERRVLTSQTAAAALNMIDRNPHLLDFSGLVLAHPAWHAGIVGIVASRMVEQFGKPAVLLLTPPDGPARGSARSIPSVDIGAAIAGCSELLMGHGGHPGAAGVTLEAANVDAFRRELSRQIELHQIPDAPTGLIIDAEASLADLNLELAEALQMLAPFGNGNPTPRFLTRGVTIEHDRRMGADGAHRRLTVSQAGAQQQVVWFHGGDAELPPGKIDLVYTLSINEYKGNRSLQLMFEGIRAAEPLSIQDQVDKADAPIQPMTVYDWRDRSVTVADLPENAQWYAEGVKLAMTAKDARHPAFASRLAITSRPDAPLVIWNAPPSLSLLRRLVEQSGARAVYLCAQESADDTLEGVLKQVAGMCKFALARDGLLTIDRMAARLGTAEEAVRVALLWLEQRGLITVAEWSPEDAPTDAVRIAPGGQARQDEELALRRARLEEELSEVRARRRFYRRARLQELGLESRAG